MITSFSRLFRQIFGGSRAQPGTEAPSRDIGAGSEAREAAEHRENLKRAMEAAFATPTATADERVEAPPLAVAALQAAAEEAATAIVALEASAEAQTPDATEVEETPLAEEAAVEDAVVAEPLEAAAEVVVVEPVAPELPPAIELAEVEVATEHDIEIVEWDVTKLAAESAETPALENVAEAVESDAVSENEDEAQPLEASAMEEEATPEAAAGEEPEPALTEEFKAAAAKPKRTKKTKTPAKKKSTTTKKKTAAKKTAGLPEDAVWLSDAIAFSLKGEWATVWTPPEDESGAERLEAFREKAAASDIVVWGRPEGGDAWEPVKATYWKTAMVEPLSFLMGRENVMTDPKASKAKKPVKYTALKVAQADVEALWPPATGEAVRAAA